MTKSATPKETVSSNPGESRSLGERYAELLKLREEVRKLASSGRGCGPAEASCSHAEPG
jgi:hypothetical protein